MAVMTWTACFFGLFCSAATIAASGGRQQVLLMSMDGFRWDYLSKDFRSKFKISLPNFDKLEQRGVASPKGNIPPFITQTFPSHYTTSTGLYPESHGIVANSFFDPKFAETFKKSDRDYKWWSEGEPIWITARKRSLTSATFFWPGSEVDFDGVRPNHWKNYNESVPFHERVTTVISWLEEGIDLVTVYFDQPDSSGHEFGPDSPEVASAVVRMDGVLGDVMEAIETSKAELRTSVNVLLTSDHGMFPTSLKTSVSLGDFLSPSEADIVNEGPVVHIINQSLSVKEIYEKIKDANDAVRFYLHDSLPAEWHYKHNRRIAPIVGVADLGWQTFRNASSNYKSRRKGGHGWPNTHLEMRPIFFAYGPAFRSNFQSEPFETVNYYPLMCHLLDIEPAPNNGSLTNVQHLLAPSVSLQTKVHSSSTQIFSMILIAMWLI